ncbi:MAG: BON domain-containing protein [Bdellovibrionota bacterium]
MINKIIVTGVLLTVGFACAEKPYKSSETMMPTNTQADTQTDTQSYERSTAEADNTAMNKRDTDDRTLVPTDQVEGSKADVELTRKIREMLTDEDSLSMKAQNVKIITLKGITTLRGPVNTMAEKRKIEQLAKSAGAKRIKNHLEVTTKTE